jgi:hypothetical protein
MSWAIDDPIQLLTPPDREFAGFAQGVIKAWNPGTFENTVRVRNANFHDLPVASGVEALTYQPDDTVMLTRWKPRSGAAVYWIGMGGRVIVPGTGAAERTVTFMQTQLGRAVAAGVFADRVQFDLVATGESRSSTSFGNLATTGPSVTVEISAARKAMVELSATLLAASGGAPHMSFEVTGATSISPSATRMLALAPDSATVLGATNSVLIPLGPSQLNEGAHTFTAKYRSGTGLGTNVFGDRVITVTAY